MGRASNQLIHSILDNINTDLDFLVDISILPESLEILLAALDVLKESKSLGSRGAKPRSRFRDLVKGPVQLAHMWQR